MALKFVARWDKDHQLITTTLSYSKAPFSAYPTPISAKEQSVRVDYQKLELSFLAG